jgi:hypothetical protein
LSPLSLHAIDGTDRHAAQAALGRELGCAVNRRTGEGREGESALGLGTRGGSLVVGHPCRRGVVEKTDSLPRRVLTGWCGGHQRSKTDLHVLIIISGSTNYI